jgi:hypothetical protein
MPGENHRQTVTGTALEYFLGRAVWQAGLADYGHWLNFPDCSEQLITIIKAIDLPAFTFKQNPQSIPYGNVRLNKEHSSFAFITADHTIPAVLVAKC